MWVAIIFLNNTFFFDMCYYNSVFLLRLVDGQSQFYHKSLFVSVRITNLLRLCQHDAVNQNNNY